MHIIAAIIVILLSPILLLWLNLIFSALMAM